MKPIAFALLVFCGPLLLVVAEAFRARASAGGLVLVAVQIAACALSAYQIYSYTLFYTPAIGWYLSLGALLTIFVAAVIEIVLRVRMRRRHDRRGVGLTLSS